MLGLPFGSPKQSFEERCAPYAGMVYRHCLHMLKNTHEAEDAAQETMLRAFRAYPSFCGKGAYGLKVHEMALEYGVKVTGATVHFVNEIPDGGKIIAQKAVEILEDDTPEVLQRRVMEQAEWILLPQAVEMISEKLAKGEK